MDAAQNQFILVAGSLDQELIQSVFVQCLEMWALGLSLGFLVSIVKRARI